MVKSVRATFKDGVFQPDEPFSLSQNTRVRLIVEALESEEEQRQAQQSWDMIEKLWRESKFNSHGDRLSRDELHERR